MMVKTTKKGPRSQMTYWNIETRKESLAKILRKKKVLIIISSVTKNMKVRLIGAKMSELNLYTSTLVKPIQM